MTPQELKNSILQLAIQGKLVEPNVRDCPIDLSVIKQKKTDDYEFELPDNWRLVHLETITKNIPSKPYQVLESQVLPEGKFPVISQSKEYSIGFSNERNKVYYHNRPVIIFGDHTTEVKFVNFDFVVSADGVKIFEPNYDIVNDKYLLYVFKFYVRDLSKVGGYSRHYKYIKNKPIPLPPLAEQKRIVAKIEELLPYIDRYEQAWSKLEQFNSRFPEDMKKSLLQYAIQGKLVEQRPEEGTAEELFAQIQEEKQRLIAEKKIKKEKPLPEITDDEKPFDIPESWKWVRLGNIISLVSGTDFKPEQYNNQGRGTVYITGASNLSNDGVIVSRWTETPRNFAYHGDILLVCKGSGYGKTVFCNVDEAHIARQIMAIRQMDALNMSYIRYVLQANIIYLKTQGQGVIPGIDRASILNMFFPLPPLAEQKRVVEKLEQLLPLCERLK